MVSEFLVVVVKDILEDLDAFLSQDLVQRAAMGFTLGVFHRFLVVKERHSDPHVFRRLAALGVEQLLQEYLRVLVELFVRPFVVVVSQAKVVKEVVETSTHSAQEGLKALI